MDVDNPFIPPQAAALIDDLQNSLHFSPVSIWEVAIKTARGKPEFQIDASDLRMGLLRRSYIEIAVTGAHAIVAGQLPPLHKDPFDRMLVAQATVESLTLITADKALAAYPGPIRLVGQ